VAIRKEIFLWQLVAKSEVSGLPKVGRSPTGPSKLVGEMKACKPSSILWGRISFGYTCGENKIT